MIYVSEYTNLEMNKYFNALGSIFQFRYFFPYCYTGMQDCMVRV